MPRKTTPHCSPNPCRQPCIANNHARRPLRPKSRTKKMRETPRHLYARQPQTRSNYQKHRTQITAHHAPLQIHNNHAVHHVCVQAIPHARVSTSNWRHHHLGHPSHLQAVHTTTRAHTQTDHQNSVQATTQNTHRTTNATAQSTELRTCLHTANMHGNAPLSLSH